MNSEALMSITQRVVAFARKVVAWPNRRPWLQFLSDRLMRSMARVAMRRAGAKPAQDLEGLFEQWQRSSPALADYRLKQIEGDTVYAEIHSQCALRGSGDVGACYRMMEYDREIMRKVGGQLVVLPSQASPGRTFCQVVLRNASASMADLTPAHKREACSR